MPQKRGPGGCGSPLHPQALSTGSGTQCASPKISVCSNTASSTMATVRDPDLLVPSNLSPSSPSSTVGCSWALGARGNNIRGKLSCQEPCSGAEGARRGGYSLNPPEELILRVPEALRALGSLFCGCLAAQQTYFLTKKKGCRGGTAAPSVPCLLRIQGARRPLPRPRRVTGLKAVWPTAPLQPGRRGSPEETFSTLQPPRTMLFLRIREPGCPGQHAPGLERSPSARASLT